LDVDKVVNVTNFIIDGWYLHVPAALQDAFPNYEFDDENYTTTAYGTLECFPEDIENMVQEQMNA